MNLSKKQLAVIAIIIANIIWGAASPIYKWSFHTIHPFTLAFLRFALPAILIGVVFPKRLSFRLKDFFPFVFAGLFGITINIGGLVLGIERTASINSPIIGSAGPAFLILGAIFFLGERPSRKMLIGNLVGLTGILFIVIEPLLHTSPSGTILGNMLLVIATIGSTAGTLLVKDLAKKYSAITITFWTFIFGATPFFLPFAEEVRRYGLVSQLESAGVFGILYAAIFSSLIAYSLLYFSLKYIFASDTTVFSYLDPVVAVLVAAPLVNEYPSPLFMLGAFFVFVGMYIAENHRRFGHAHHQMKR